MGIIHVAVKLTDFAGDNRLSSDFFPLFLAILGGPMAAPVFIFAMGVGYVYTRNKSPSVLAIRGVKLIFQGYLLNFFKETIPTLLAKVFDIEEDYPDSILTTLARGDVLHFSGLFFLLVALLSLLNLHAYFLFLATLLFQGIGTLLIGHLHSLPKVIQYFLGLIFYTNELSCFPLALYLIYPVVGILFGVILTHVQNKAKFYALVFATALVFALVVTMDCYYIEFDIRYFFVNYVDSYKKQHFLSALWILGVDGMLFALYHIITRFISGTPEQVIKTVSQHTTSIYVLHWLILSYTRFIKNVFGGGVIPTWTAFPIGIALILLTMLLAVYYKKGTSFLKAKWKAYRESRLKQKEDGGDCSTESERTPLVVPSASVN